MHALPKMEYEEIRLLSKVELFLDSFWMIQKFNWKTETDDSFLA